jgi:hypothetical protein
LDKVAKHSKNVFAHFKKKKGSFSDALYQILILTGPPELVRDRLWLWLMSAGKGLCELGQREPSLPD